MAGSSDLNEGLDRDALLEELTRVRAEGMRLSVRIDELEQLRSRAAADIGDLRTDLQKRADAYRDLDRRHEDLKALFSLASEQLGGVAENGSLRWMYPSDSEARGRIIAAERLTHELLSGFSDDVLSIADQPGTVLLVAALRARTSTMLEQLESAQCELTLTMERLARYERTPLRRLVRRIVASRTFQRLRFRVRSR